MSSTVAGDDRPVVLVVGSINVDLTLRTARIPLSGETVHGRGPEVYPGGKGANQAVAAARLGARVALAGAVGDDPYAETALRELRRSGVGLDLVATHPGPCGMAFITVDDEANNVIVVTPGANATVTADRVDGFASAVEAADLVVLQGEIPVDGIVRVIELARGRIVLNLAPVVDLPAAALLAADPLVVNEYEARLATELITGQLPGAEVDDATVAAGLFAAGVRSLIMTRGEQGALVVDGSGLTAVPSPRVEAVDTTGAGDAFVGGLTAALAGGATLDDAARFAVRVGAFACTRSGAQPSYPGQDDPLPG